MAEYFLESPTIEESAARQDAVRELWPRADLREKVALLGDSFHKSKWETFAEWLGAPAMPPHSLLRILMLTTSGFLACSILTAFVEILPWSQIFLLSATIACIHSVLGLVFRKQVRRVIESVRPVGIEITVLREGLDLLRQQRFTSPKLIGLVEQLQYGEPIKSIRKLERLIGALNERNKEWFYGPSLLLLFGTQISMAIERWRAKHGEALAGWLDAWADFEALNALAGYAYEHPEDTFPEFTSEETVFEADGLGHPLLAENNCVRNDVHLNARQKFYLVSGSTCPGKALCSGPSASTRFWPLRDLRCARGICACPACRFAPRCRLRILC